MKIVKSNHRNRSHIPRPLICIYTNQNRNEFAIGLEKDENFMAITKVGDSYTRFVDAYDQIINDENKVNWKLELKRWIAAAKKNESIFVEIDLSGWNQEGERID
ncbi:MAG: hypothetical protein WBP64_21220 [Nitrososphaeraceae archaeon]|jgi:hypothetical protein